MVEKYKKEKKSSEVKRIHKFGGKGKKKGADIDVCIKVKGEDGSINEIVIKGEEKKKKKKGKKQAVDMIKEIIGEEAKDPEGIPPDIEAEMTKMKEKLEC